MGTRADFYIIHGAMWRWLGSLSHDGYPKEPKSKRGSGVPKSVTKAPSEELFEAAVRQHLRRMDRLNQTAIWPEEGWPWPWEDSDTTDYVYAFDLRQERVRIADSYLEAGGLVKRWTNTGERAAFPEMSTRRGPAELQLRHVYRRIENTS